ncbi:hypothetical protein PFJ02_23395 [Mycobacterium xenopi]|uniref:Uncharacterized protein n=2 Tax=Mycobacterium xenopi TaxID=1789 RepID=A0AAD1H6V1_MYCXE|nr:hypothetical protein [Mycobacterium xenopi]MDA3664915.1 hypothetical protein [Mycobacterium xenopi]ORX21335.1 hypothetical protein AWC32_01070 [Mycobacterium xenopi]BBU24749.1 hypothetical protein MYXE_45390 [Mycobacterium xenopi]SPX89959.1 Uncharacterised protein [Mycobacterium xenopi]
MRLADWRLVMEMVLLVSSGRFGQCWLLCRAMKLADWRLVMETVLLVSSGRFGQCWLLCRANWAVGLLVGSGCLMVEC